MEVEMKIRGLMMDPITNMPIVILKEAIGNGILPIWVGVYEANAIALEIEKVVTPRPMTHDLLKNVLVGLDAAVQKVVVTTINHAIVVLVSLNAFARDATIVIADEDTALLVNSRVKKVEQVSRVATAIDSGGADASALDWIVRRSVNSLPGSAAVKG